MNHRGKRIVMGLMAVFSAFGLGLTVQAEEVQRHGPAQFTDFDVDGNGSISESEFNSVRSQRMAARAAEGKKMRCAAEAPAFADLDTDSDGQLNADELSAGQKAHMKKCRAMGHGAGKGKGGTHHKPLFSDFDVDANGMISEAEFNDAHAKRMGEMAAQGHQMKHAGDMPAFSGIDSNGDGGINEQEFDEHLAAHHRQMQEKPQKPD